MKPVSSSEIRGAFLDFFATHGHAIVPSSSLIPEGDPTLLFTSAGMVQFKPYFAGELVPANRRLASCQKCFRTTDIDEIGDESHLTFFEMLGNFSIGDYFKEGAIEMAWEFVTQHMKLPVESLWVTIYLDDEEAHDVWRDRIELPEGRILRFDKEYNYWGPAGATGPCGPDSEIFYDRGSKYGCGDSQCGPNCPRCNRYLELWNLVFMQYHQSEAGELTPLPQKNIDTGMGLERAAVVMQEASSVFETDLFVPVIARVEELTRVKYDPDSERSMRIIAEHGRAAAFLIADGVLPSNEGRGYVLRRILRKAVYHGYRLGRGEPFLGSIAEVVGEVMGERYPELGGRRDFISQVQASEEERFHATLTVGARRLDELLANLASSGGKVLPGEETFRLYDTYGLPVDLVREVAAEHGFAIDERGFETAMGEQRERARAAQRFGPQGEGELYRKLDLPPSEFLGYETLEAEVRVLAVVRDGKAVPGAKKEDEVEIILDRTPFYAEAGGQVGDTGLIIGPHGRVKISDTQSPLPRIVAHRGLVEEGKIKQGDGVQACVDGERRLDIARNHTATHLLHKALREIVGEHAAQSGSYVAPDRLRFDFTHLAHLSSDEISRIESLVNAKIRANLSVSAEIQNHQAAIASGAVALFGEKYGERVRVIQVGDYSRELCGGTHLASTGQIGLFHILSEGSIGAGLRRIEALTGRGAERYVQEVVGAIKGIADRLQVAPADVLQRVQWLVEELERQSKELVLVRRRGAKDNLSRLLSQVVEIEGVKVLAAQVEASDIDAMRETVDWVKDKLPSVIVVLGAVIEDRPIFVVAVTPDLTERVRADWLSREVASLVGGGGGGQASMAQAGGREPGRLQEALKATLEIVAKRLEEA